jgi:hypothetical protein
MFENSSVDGVDFRLWPTTISCQEQNEAAAGLMMVMSSATALHLVRGESGSAVAAAVLFVLVTIVAYTRWKVQPIAARKHA